MQRNEIVQICDLHVLEPAAKAFGTTKDLLTSYESYEGCQNLVYDYIKEGKPFILRISYRPDRSYKLIQAELHFVNYLAEHGVRVARGVPSINGNLIETIHASGIDFQVVSMIKGKGMRVPDNEYKYREGVPIKEYFQNWGRVLGQMHRLAKDYQPISESIRRPYWFELDRYIVDERVPRRYPAIQVKYDQLMAEIHRLPKDRDSFGLIHGDFNDGNFTLDYSNGDITVFDFDDCCYGWFIEELTSAWEGGVGRAMFKGLSDRKAFMELYFEQVLEGYHKENTLSHEWLERLPLFLKLIQMEEFLYYAQYMDDTDEELQAGLRYKATCIENDIPYLGFFDSIYSPDRPFSL